MRYSIIFSLAAVSSAFVVPNEQVFANIAIEKHEKDSWYGEVVAAKDSVLSGFKKHFDEVADSSKKVWDEAADSSKKVWDDATNAIDEAMSTVDSAAHAAAERIQETAFDAQGWLESGIDDLDEAVEDEFEHFGPPPPHHGPPDDGRHHPRPPHRRPHHGRPHHGHRKPNATVYELINSSKYTTRLAKLINEFPDLVKSLNNTELHFTVFVPSDKAFEKIPEHHKPSKEQLLKVLSYHVVPDFYPAARVLVTHTVPTLLQSDSLGKDTMAQRLRLHLGLRGLTVNFYSRIIYPNIFATNGVLHAVDSLLIPPPSIVKIIDLLPAEFSTLELGLGKTGLLEKLNTTKHAGGTFFAPDNSAFARLGPGANAFLFSERGLKYLKALLEYHVVYNNTLYSDAFYSAEADNVSIPKGRYHVELPTLLKDRSLSVDVSRFGGWITMKVNGFTSVKTQDGIAADGVIQVPSNVLIPPRHVNGEESFWEDSERSVDELKARLAPYMAKHDL